MKRILSIMLTVTFLIPNSNVPLAGPDFAHLKGLRGAESIARAKVEKALAITMVDQDKTDASKGT